MSDAPSPPAGDTNSLVIFTPAGKRGQFPVGTSVLDAARRLGVDLDSVCGGRGICGRCQVDVAEGAFAKHGIESRTAHVSPSGATEARYAEKRGPLPAGRRLACQATLVGNVVIDVPERSQVHRQVVRKAADDRPIAVDPVVRLCYVEVAQPDILDPSSDFHRLQGALAAQWGIAEATAGLSLLSHLQKTLRAGQWAVTVAIRGEREVVGLWPGLRERAYGIAVDIGSTTIAAHLTDLTSGEVIAAAGAMNPQIRFGDDLMSRVSYVMMNPGGDRELTAAVRVALDTLVGDVCAQAGLDRADVVEMTAVGNPVMHHLLLGLDPVELGWAPFALAIDAAIDVPAQTLGLMLAPGAMVHVLPCIAGHVGADAAAVVLAEAPHLRDELTLVVDIGTNAEIVLGNRSRLLACSSPTGPAFEGAQISSGRRAAPGAIERVRIDRDTLEPRFKIIGCEPWSDEPGFAEAAAANGVSGICGSGIIDVVAEMVLAGIVTPAGVIDGSMSARSARIIPDGRGFSYVLSDLEPRVLIMQADIRAIQLAKAALYAGVKLLMDRWGPGRIERILLAGAFGSHVDTVRAMVLGLIPDCDLAHVSGVGNAAGTGARIALVNAGSRREIGALVRRIEKVETALEPAFQAHFVAAMAFPHAQDAFPALAKVVALPAAEGDDTLRRRRRRRGA